MRTAGDNFWLDMPYQPNPGLWGNHEVDVAIVGGGFTGLSTAYFLKLRNPDIKVAILEKQFIGFGSSGRNTGISGGTLGHSIDRLKKIYGIEKVIPLQKLALRSYMLVEELIKEHEIDCDYEKCGLMTLARSAKDIETLEHEARACEEAGLNAELLGKEEASARFGALKLLGGLNYTDQGRLNPGKFVRGMKRVVESLGVDVYENSECTRIEPGPELLLYTPGGSVRAKQIVMATNAYSNPLGLYKSKLFPLYIYHIITEPLTKAQMDELQFGSPTVAFNARHLFWAVRPTADNRLIFINNDAMSYFNRNKDYSHRPREYRKHYKLMVKLFPFLKGVKITHQWGGCICMTLDFMPFIGQTGKHKNIFYSLGYNGHGVAMCQLAGQMTAALMEGETSELTNHALINRRGVSLPSTTLSYLGINAYKTVYKIDDWIRNMKK